MSQPTWSLANSNHFESFKYLTDEYYRIKGICVFAARVIDNDYFDSEEELLAKDGQSVVEIVVNCSRFTDVVALTCIVDNAEMDFVRNWIEERMPAKL